MLSNVTTSLKAILDGDEEKAAQQKVVNDSKRHIEHFRLPAF